MSVTVALMVRIAQHWLKLLPAVMSFVPGCMYVSGVCYRCLLLDYTEKPLFQFQFAAYCIVHLNPVHHIHSFM
jgi:hypothetical protein